MTKLKWDADAPKKINKGGYVTGDEILSVIALPEGYSVWATADIDDCHTQIIIWGHGDTEEEAKEDLWININQFLKQTEFD